MPDQDLQEIDLPDAETGSPTPPEAEAGRSPQDPDGDGPQDEDPSPPPLDPEVAARRRAALKQVRRWGDPVLRTKARPVDRFDEVLRAQTESMGSLMDDALGVGLAATQIGLLQRLFVYRIVSGTSLHVIVNPVVQWSSKEDEVGEEGCLSLPAVHVDVERPVHISLKAQDEWGLDITVEASGLEARVILHELDHLDGVMILDRTTRGQRKEAMRALREALAADEQA